MEEPGLVPVRRRAIIHREKSGSQPQPRNYIYQPQPTHTAAEKDKNQTPRATLAAGTGWSKLKIMRVRVRGAWCVDFWGSSSFRFPISDEFCLFVLFLGWWWVMYVMTDDA